MVFSPSTGFRDLPMVVPCGQCIGCRLERSRQWASRMMAEAQFHELSVFVTLTYEVEPEGGTLVKADFQKFMKRLRKTGAKVRYFMCGEYGETTLRPHYHAILFGIDFPDKEVHTKNAQGHVLYKSETLTKLWGHGHCLIGEVTFETAAYTARYCLKKVTGDRAESHYRGINPVTGEIFNRIPEYCDMSRRPGIGKGWFDEFQTDVYPSDEFVSRGYATKPPRYFDKLLEREDPNTLQAIKRARIRNAKARASDSTPDRLAVRKQVKEAQISTLKRSI